MSIKPPSDIVLDVARAADPARLREAARRLGAEATASAGADFGAAMQGAREAAPAPASARETLAALSTPSPHPTAATPAETPQAYRDLEAFFLRTAFDTMLPASSRTGAGSGVWKSMLADALATETARAGGIGLFGATVKGGSA